MTFNYDNIRDIVKKQVAAFGQSATLRQPGAATGPDYDPTPGTPTDYAVKVVTSRFTIAERAGSLVQEDDLVFLMSTEGDPDPNLKGTLMIGSTTYQVFKLNPISPGATIVGWRVYCRK